MKTLAAETIKQRIPQTTETSITVYNKLYDMCGYFSVNFQTQTN